jgi:hypothetical protein
MLGKRKKTPFSDRKVPKIKTGSSSSSNDELEPVLGDDTRDCKI